MSNEYYCITSDGSLSNPEIRFSVADEESGITVGEDLFRTVFSIQSGKIATTIFLLHLPL